MQKEKLAAIGLAVIIIGALSAYLVIEYKDEIIENLSGDGGKTTENGNGTIEIGDCVDVHYIGRYASNDTVFASSYEDVEGRTGGTPLHVFVSTNISELPPLNYSSYISSPLMAQTIEEYLYLALTPLGVKEGFIEELITMEKGASNKITTSHLPPEKAFGVALGIDTIINLTSISQIPLEYKVLDIQEAAPMPSEIIQLYGDYFGDETTLFTLRDNLRKKGEIIDKYSSWENSTVVTKLNETLLWMYTTPPYDVGVNFTWTDFDSETGVQFVYPTNTSCITNITSSTIVITHTPEYNTTIEESIYYAQYDMYFPNATYTVENVTDDKINVSYTDQLTGDESYKDLDRTTVIQRNQTQNITEDIPGEILEMQLLFLRESEDDFTFSFNVLSDETVYFELEVVNVYNTSQES